MVYFPSFEWLKEYERLLNESEEYSEAGEGWGIEFDGDFVFFIQDLPMDEVSISDFPESLREQLEEYVSGDTIYVYIGLKDGKCTGTAPLKDLDEKDHGFELKGQHEMWKKAVKGEMDVARGLFFGEFELAGDLTRVMRSAESAEILARYTDTVDVLTDLAREVPDTEFVDEKY